MNPPVTHADSAVLVTFGNEAFETIEPFLERAWNQCRSEHDPEWAEIRHLVLDARTRARPMAA